MKTKFLKIEKIVKTFELFWNPDFWLKIPKNEISLLNLNSSTGYYVDSTKSVEILRK